SAPLSQPAPVFSADDPPSSTRLAGLAPIRYLETMKHLAPELIARARARALGLPVAAANDGTAEALPAGLLPDGLVKKHRVTVRAFDPTSMIVAAPCPTARLVREVAALFPDTPVAWQILPHLGETQHEQPLESIPAA